MINFQHELSKIQKSLNDKVITEQTASYEITKLQCLAKKLKAECNLPKQNIIITQSMVNEDYKELYGLKNNGLLKDKYFIRDNSKILALCEQYGLQFPGDKDVLGKILIDDTARLLSESDGEYDEYDGLEDEDEFDYNEFSENEPQLEAEVTLPNGTVLQKWNIDSEVIYSIDEIILERRELAEIILTNIDYFGGLYDLIENIKSVINAATRTLNKWLKIEPENEHQARTKNQIITQHNERLKKLRSTLDNIKNGVADEEIIDFVEIE